jgi:prepilin-type N-terminal cleavage/methylation domain-containing protein
MRKPRNGFSLIELLLVVAIILIVAAMTVPNLLRSKIAANESSAVGSVRTIHTAEMTYQATWGTGFAVGLGNLGGPSPCLVATAAAACIADPLLSNAPFTKSGYVFNAAGTVLLNNVLNGYELNATPVLVQTTGVRAFCAYQTGLIQFVTPGNAPIGIGPGTCAGIPNVPGTSGPVN